ncbi:hypothetical protein GCM10009859_11740 [Kocuria salsicia]
MTRSSSGKIRKAIRPSSRVLGSVSLVLGFVSAQLYRTKVTGGEYRDGARVEARKPARREGEK